MSRRSSKPSPARSTALSDDDLRRSAVVVLNDVEVDAPAGEETGALRRAGRRVVRGDRTARDDGRRRSICCPATIGTTGRSHSRRRGPRRRARVRASRLRAVPRAAQRRLLVDSRLRISQPDGGEGRAGARAIRCRNARGDRATRRDGAECCCGRRHSTCRGAICRPSRCSCRSCTRAVRYLAGYTEPEPWLTVGQVLECVSRDGSWTGGAACRCSPRPGVVSRWTTREADVLELTEQGFYEVRGEANQAEAIVAANVDPAEADLTPMDPKEIAAAAVGGATGARGWADRGSTDAGSARKKSAVVVVSAGRRNPAAGGGYAPVQPYGESVNYELPATSQPGGPLMLEYLRRASTPTDLLDIIAEVRRRWRLKLALRGIVRVLAILLAFFLVAAALHAVGPVQPRPSSRRASLARRDPARVCLLVPLPSASAARDRRTGGALPRGARAVAPGDAAERGGVEPRGQRGRNPQRS